jgi:hypothetical protein
MRSTGPDSDEREHRAAADPGSLKCRPEPADDIIVRPAAPPVDGRHWLTSKPLTWNDLSGQVVIVVFWSHGCQASLLRVRQIESLVATTDFGLTALAVHTPRFAYEEELASLRSVVTQHRIGLPVVHDPDYVTWNRYQPEGWPATVVVDATGRVLGMQSGSDDVDLLAQCVALGLESITGVSRSGQSRRVAPLPLPGAIVAFPTAVDARPSGELVVADAGHDRLLLFELSPDRRRAEAVAEINGIAQPNSVAADGSDGIYVSEQARGAVSYLDLAARTRQRLTADLAAPTSLVIDSDGSLVMADGGGEQLYRLIYNGPDDLTLGLIAGTGRTGCHDGDAAEAELAQPTGLTRTGAGLVFCDAASSNLRLLTDTGRVATITGNGFFQWGLVDGPAHKAMLQRPSDTASMADGSVVVVDTGNNRLRRLANRRIRTMGLQGLNRPMAACALPDGGLVVADTGNHRLVVVEPALQRAWPLELVGVPDPLEVVAATSAPTP